MTNQQVLMKRLQICDFVLIETALFLDTHPKDKEALAHYHKYLEMKKEALAEYTKNYGTIDLSHPHSQDKWDWVENPWPWEGV